MIQRIGTAIGYHLSSNFFRISLRALFRFRVIGGKNTPKRGPFIMASNHVSYMDPAIIGGTFFRRLYFVTSEHLYKHKLAALWYNSVGCIKIKRDAPRHTVMKKLLSLLKKGKPVAIFPEGTRSADGKMQEPLSGVGFLALKSQAPVLPCFIKGSDKALPRGAKAFKFNRITIYIGKPIDPKEFKFEGDKREAYRLFSKKVMHAITVLGKINED